MIQNLLGKLSQQVQQQPQQPVDRMAPQLMPRRPFQPMTPMQRQGGMMPNQFAGEFNRMAMPQPRQDMGVSPEQLAMVNQMMQQAVGRNAMPGGANYWAQDVQRNGQPAAQSAMNNSMESMAYKNKLAQLARLNPLPAFSGLNAGAIPGVQQGQSAAEFIAANMAKALGR